MDPTERYKKLCADVEKSLENLRRVKEEERKLKQELEFNTLLYIFVLCFKPIKRPENDSEG